MHINARKQASHHSKYMMYSITNADSSEAFSLLKQGAINKRGKTKATYNFFLLEDRQPTFDAIVRLYHSTTKCNNTTKKNLSHTSILFP